MRAFWVVLLAGLLALAGCRTPREPAAVAPSLPGSPPPAVETAPRKPSVLATLWPPNWFKWLFPKKPAPPQAQAPQFIGVVKMVNTEDQFVLIDAVSHQGTEAGTLLLCITEQKETAHLRMSPLKNPPFLIADITSGSPAPGDRVFKP